MELDSFVKSSLQKIGLANYSNCFSEHEIDKFAFLRLTQDEIKSLLPNKLGPQKKLWNELQNIRTSLRPQPAPATVNTIINSSNQLKPESCKDSNISNTRSQNGIELRRKSSQPSNPSQINPSPNRKASVLQVEPPNNAAAPKSASPSRPSTNLAVPIAITLLTGVARQHIITKYTTPAVKNILDDEPIPSPSSGLRGAVPLESDIQTNAISDDQIYHEAEQVDDYFDVQPEMDYSEEIYFANNNDQQYTEDKQLGYQDNELSSMNQNDEEYDYPEYSDKINYPEYEDVQEIENHSDAFLDDSSPEGDLVEGLITALSDLL